MPFMYAIYDTKAECYEKPFEAMNKEVAIRMIETAMDNQNLLFLSAEDYQLFTVAEWDPHTGKMNPAHNHVINLNQIKARYLKKAAEINHQLPEEGTEA